MKVLAGLCLIALAWPGSRNLSPGEGFNKGEATKVLGKASTDAKICKTKDGPSGPGKVKVTFQPSGKVSTATVDGPPFQGTAVGTCVAKVFAQVRIPPFDGAPVSVVKTFTID